MFTQSQIVDNIGTITLDNPAKRNALSRALVEEVIGALGKFKEAGARVVVLRAAADAKVWSAGHDISELPQGEDPLQYSDALEQLLRAVSQCPAPVIAMVHGSVWGGATDLVLTCDLIIGDETSSFAITPANLGLAYNTVGLLHFLRRLPLNLIKEMFFTAAPLAASAAEKWGILNHLVPAAELEKFTYDMARVMASKAPLVLSSVKEQLRLLSQAVPLSPDTFERVHELRQHVFQSADYLEGIRAFHEKRKPVFTGK
ncbi:MAG: methylmalonyl-CoA decarboxylase [Gemmataceae bacterium]